MIITSCSSSGRHNYNKHFGKERYVLKDKSGIFNLVLETGHNKDQLIVKKRTLAQENGQIVEKSVTLSKVGVLGKKYTILRPEKAYNEVWLAGKKSWSRLDLDTKTKSFKLAYFDGESGEKREEIIPFLKTQGAFCFFSQVEECALVSSFLRKAILRKAGVLSLSLILDGHPFITYQYPTLPNKLFVHSKLVYDQELKGGLHRFSLKSDHFVIFYVFDSHLKLNGIYWVAEGLSISKE